MATFEQRTIELEIISAEDLKKVSHFGHDTCYVVAYIYPAEKYSTGVARTRGRSPSWNAKLKLTCDEKLLHKAGWYITLEIYSHGSFSNKLVGTSKISLLEIGRHMNDDSTSQTKSVEVRRPSGRVKGTLNVSVLVGEKRTVDRNSQAGLAGYPEAYPPGTNDMYSVEGLTPLPPRPVYPPKPVGSNAVYPPPKPAGEDADEPVTAYPVYPGPYGAPGGYYGSQYGPYGGPQQQYYYPAGYQVQSYGSSSGFGGSGGSRWGGSSSGGAGFGLLGGLLGGLLLGDLIGGGF